MGRGVRRGMFDDAEPERRQVEACEHRFAASEHHGRDGEMHFVDEAGLKILPDRRDAAADLHVLVAGRRPGLFERGLDPVGDEVKDRAALHLDGVARIVGEHEGRGVIRGIVAPPALPLVVGPVAADGAEHVAAQDEGAEAVHRAGRDSRCRCLSEPPSLPSISWNMPVSDHPRMQFLAALAERIFEALVRPGAVAVDGKRKSGNDHLAHGRVLSVCILQAVVNYQNRIYIASSLRRPCMDKPIRSGCPINLTLETLGDRWSLIVIRDIMFGNRRHYRDLLNNSEEGIASNILADRLKKLVEAGLLSTSPDPTHKQKTVYSLTEPAIQLVPLLAQMGAWGRRFTPATRELSIRAQLLEEGGPDDVGGFHGGTAQPASRRASRRNAR